MRCLFFMLGIVDSARFTPRGALRLNHLFGAGRFAMRASTLALALIRITSSKNRGVFFCIEKTALSDGFLIFVVVWITLRNRRF